MDVALGKFFLDALKELRDVFVKAQARKDNLVAVGTFLELYGSATRLEGYATRLHGLEGTDRTSQAAGELLREFFDEVHHFGELLRKANLSAIEVYHPELASELARVIGEDASLIGTFTHHIAPRFSLKPSKLQKIVDLYVNFYGVHDGGAWHAERELRYGLPHYRDEAETWDRPAVWERFKELAAYLAAFRAVIGEVIRSTWDFKELATLPSTKKS